MQRTFYVLLVFLMLAACADEIPQEPAAQQEPYTEHSEASDLVEVTEAQGKLDGITSSFEPNHVMAENFFLARDMLTASQVQAFLEETPYGTRSWLADEVVGGLPASAVIVDVSYEQGVNPLVMLARMQVEKGLISKTERPGGNSVDFAFGCGCPDYRSCSEAYRGFANQIRCAAETLRALHDASVDGSGQWRAGASKRTLDGLYVRPENHATAALYGYTPWVLRGRGGNWLVWNITLRFARHLEDKGVIDLSSPALSDPFIGSPCESDEQCLFQASGAEGFCHRYQTDAGPRGFCVTLCEGTCPDRSGHAWTFCAKVEEVGMCVSQAREENQKCEDLEGTSPQVVDRYIGDSGSSARQAEVCLP